MVSRPNSPELSSIDYKIKGEHELQVTRLNKIRASDWLKSGNATAQHLSERILFLSVFISPHSAESLGR